MKGTGWGEKILAVFFLTFFAVLILTSMTYSSKARRMPLVVLVPGIVLTAAEVFRGTIKRGAARKANKQKAKGQDSETPERKKLLEMIGWVILLVGMIWTLGFLITIPLYTLSFMRTRKETWRISLLFAAFGFASLYFLFVVGLRMELYPGLIFRQ